MGEDAGIVQILPQHRLSYEKVFEKVDAHSTRAHELTSGFLDYRKRFVNVLSIL